MTYDANWESTAHTACIAANGTVYLPPEVREQLALTKGAELQIVLEGDRIVLRPKDVQDWCDFGGRRTGVLGFLADLANDPEYKGLRG